MAKNATISARIDERLKAEAEHILTKVGVSTSDAITMYYRQIVLRKGLPFDVRIPNKATAAAIAELDAGKGERFDGSAEELFDHILKPRRKRRA